MVWLSLNVLTVARRARGRTPPLERRAPRDTVVVAFTPRFTETAFEIRSPR